MYTSAKFHTQNCSPIWATKFIPISTYYLEKKELVITT